MHCYSVIVQLCHWRNNMKRSTFMPDQESIAWTKNLIANLKEGGSWLVPYNGQIYRIFHSKKELHLISGDDKILFEKNQKIFWMFGYKVYDKRNK